MANLKQPRASIACSRNRDPDYLLLASEGFEGLAAVALFDALLCAAKDQDNDGRFNLPDRVIAAMVGIEIKTYSKLIQRLIKIGWLVADGEGVAVRSFAKWNPRDERGGARSGAGRQRRSGNQTEIKTNSNANQNEIKVESNGIQTEFKTESNANQSEIKPKSNGNQNWAPPSPSPSPSPLPVFSIERAREAPVFEKSKHFASTFLPHFPPVSSKGIGTAEAEREWASWTDEQRAKALEAVKLYRAWWDRIPPSRTKQAQEKPLKWLENFKARGFEPDESWAKTPDGAGIVTQGYRRADDTYK